MGTPPDRDKATGQDGAGVAATQVGTCQWRPRTSAPHYKCTQPVEALILSVCILHNPDMHKDLDRFHQALREKIDREEADDGITVINLAGVVYPPADVNFAGRVFKKTVTFAEADFGGDAKFQHAQFSGEADFRRVQFSGAVHFLHARFQEVASFRGAWFASSASFRHSRFGGAAYFRGTQFGGQSDFWNVHFEAEASFWLAQFDGETGFASASFDQGAYFLGARFDRGPNFRHAHFGAEAYFPRSRFHGVADFQGTRFGGPASFIGTLFPPQNSGAEVSFGSLAPESAAKVRLEGVGLSRVSFLRTDVSQVDFVGCTWAEKPAPPSLASPHSPAQAAPDGHPRRGGPWFGAGRRAGKGRPPPGGGAVPPAKA